MKAFWIGAYIATFLIGISMAASSCGPAPIELYQLPVTEASPTVIYIQQQPSPVPSCDCDNHCNRKHHQ